MDRAKPDLDSGQVARQFHLPLFAWTSFFGLAIAFLFAGFPEIDLWVSSWFYLGNRSFLFNDMSLGPIIRSLFKALFFITTLAAISGLIYAIFARSRLFDLSFPNWLFLVFCLVVGPGLVTNTLLKNNWGRARPIQVEQFDGAQKFTPVFVRSTACERNCSFVSGEAATIYASFFALAMIAYRRRNWLIRAGIIAGTASGFVRIAQGGHFLSDVLTAGIFMMLIALALHWLIFVRFAGQCTEDGPLHRWLNSLSHKVQRQFNKLRERIGWPSRREQREDDSRLW